VVTGPRGLKVNTEDQAQKATRGTQVKLVDKEESAIEAKEGH